MQIVIDDLETKLIEAFIRRKIEHRVEHLHIGDAHVSAELPVEIKRIFYNDSGVFNDVKASLEDSRYRKQSEERRDTFKRNAIIVQIEIDWKDLYNEGFTYNEFMGFIVSVQWRYNGMFYLTGNVDETIDILLLLHKREIEAGRAESINRPPRPKSLPQRQRYFVKGFIGCGDKMTDDLLLFYKTIINIIAALLNGHILTRKGFGKLFKAKNMELLETEYKKEEKKVWGESVENQ